MEELTESLAGAFAVSDNNIHGQHPHFANNYKNEGKIAERQRRRRAEFFQRQTDFEYAAQNYGVTEHFYSARDACQDRFRALYAGIQDQLEPMDIANVYNNNNVKTKTNWSQVKFKGNRQEGFEGMNFSGWGISGGEDGVGGSKASRHHQQKNKQQHYNQAQQQQSHQSHYQADQLAYYNAVNVEKNPYNNTLMFSEWLVDIPCHLDTEWTMLACPVGKRCLLVAWNGSTSAYNKSGYRLVQFQTNLPAGNRACSKKTLTMLDCIMDKPQRKYYVLDLLYWEGVQYTAIPFSTRRAALLEKFAEMPELESGESSTCNSQLPAQADEQGTIDTSMDTAMVGAPADAASMTSILPRFTFYVVDACKCTVEAMTEFMKKDFSFTIDGLLFYYSKAFYMPGQTPLVGWLKAWMLPEILNVDVPRSYISEQGFYTSTQHFIERFNQKHRFKSSIVKEPGNSSEETSVTGNVSMSAVQLEE